MKLANRRFQQQGMSLVEALVALAIGLLLTTGVVQVFSGTKQAYRTQDALARLQENGRFAMQFITYDTRMATYLGCIKNTTYSNVLNVSTTPWYYDLKTGFMGYDSSGTTNPAGVTGIRSGTDSITLVYADTRDSFQVSGHAVVSGKGYFTLEQNHDFRLGDILTASDCFHTAVFQMTKLESQKVEHRSGAETPGNSSTNASNLGYQGGAFTGGNVSRLYSAVYYVGTGASGEPALMRRRLGTNSTSPATLGDAEELVEGVENMQILYGLDNTGDQQADEYRTANQLNSSTWPQVVSIRIDLLLRSVEDRVTPQHQTYTYNGTETTATDYRLRQVFSVTVGVRNRLS